MKLLLCAACLCSAGVFVKSAMTQERTRTKPTYESPPSPDDSFPAIDSVSRKPLAPEPLATDAFAATGSVPMRPRTVTRTITETHMRPIPPEELEAMRKLRTAIQQLTTAKDDAARRAATETIQQQLTIQFEADLKQREKDLAEVELRVKTLREQLDKRKAAQADIINLRLQTLINDANGLGFPDTGFTSSKPVLQDPSGANKLIIISPEDRAFYPDEPAPGIRPAIPQIRPPE